METSNKIPPKAAYQGEPPSQAEVLERHESIQGRHHRTLEQVDELFRTQSKLGKSIRSDLAGLKKHSESLDALEKASEQDQGMLAALVSRFVQRRTVLNRKSETQALLTRHASVSMSLRKASAFTDQLRLEALELQQEVQTLHQEIRRAKANGQLAAQRILDLELQIQAFEGDAALDSDERNEQLDTLRFELRQETHNLELFGAMEKMCRQHLTPAKKLRDTVTKLQEEMAEFVVHATGTVDAAGRRIQALGAAADAPVVIQELQQSMADLNQAMEITEVYVEQTQELLSRVLPELTAQVKAEAETRNFILEGKLDEIDRERAKALAKKALQAEAEKEVEALLRGP